MFDSVATPWTIVHQAPVLSTISRVCSNSCPLSWWCHPTISSSVVPFSSCPQSFPAAGSFQMRQLFASGGQRTGVSASASALPMNIQGWFPWGWTGWISLQPKGLARVFSSPTVAKHQFFSAQPSLHSSSHICTWLWFLQSLPWSIWGWSNPSPISLLKYFRRCYLAKAALSLCRQGSTFFQRGGSFVVSWAIWSLTGRRMKTVVGFTPGCYSWWGNTDGGTHAVVRKIKSLQTAQKEIRAVCNQGEMLGPSPYIWPLTFPQSGL